MAGKTIIRRGKGRKADNSLIRLQKYLSEAGFCSRREAEELIYKGKIEIDGRKATLGDKVTGKEVITVNGAKVQFDQKDKGQVVVFHKPKGVECTLTPAAKSKTLLDYDFGAGRFFPVGHMDKFAHGLLLLTNDGNLANSLTEKVMKLEREYYLIASGEVSNEMINRLQKGGVKGKMKLPPCVAERISENTIKVITKEGRTRTVRKMGEIVGLKVTDLQLVRIGTLSIQGLTEGKHSVLPGEKVVALSR